MIYLIIAVILIVSLRFLRLAQIFKLLVVISMIFVIARFSGPIVNLISNIVRLFFQFSDKIIALTIIMPLIIKLFMILKKFYRQKSIFQKDNMSVKEAKEILELSENFTKEDIIRSYHKLMSINHPDKGGSSYFAQKINQAKEILIKSLDNIQ